jgi:uncharacterized membrane protein
MLDRNTVETPLDRATSRAERVFDTLLSPVTWLTVAGFVIGAWGTFEFGLPFYSAIVGMALGAVLGGIVRIVGALFW